MKFHRDEELAFNLLSLLKKSEEYVKVRDLVESLGTTELFLYSIVLKLKKAGLIETLPSSVGGVRRSQETINALEVMRALNRVPKKLSGKGAKIVTNILKLLEGETL